MRDRRNDSTHPSSLEPPNAFDRDFLDTFSRREPAPATPEADNAGPWRVTRLHGAGDPRWACIAAGERPPRFSFREPDLAHLTNAGLALADRPARFRSCGTPKARSTSCTTATPSATRSGRATSSRWSSPPSPTSAPSPDALAHFLLAVPDEVLQRCGVILAQMVSETG